jgi:hypothetical protein
MTKSKGDKGSQALFGCYWKGRLLKVHLPKHLEGKSFVPKKT